MVGLGPQSFRVIEFDGAAANQSEPSTEHVGAFLREARETTGRGLADIAATLRIRAKFLQAIEDGRYEDLPGPTYAAGFIRSYADYLGLDSTALLAQFKNEPSGAEAQPELEFPVPSTVGWFPTGKVVASCAVLAAAVFGGWFYLQTKDALDVAAVPPPPGAEPAESADATSEPAADDTVTLAAATEPAQPDSGSIEIPRSPVDGATVENGEQPYRLPVPVTALVAPDPVATEADLEPQAPAETVQPSPPPANAAATKAPAEATEPAEIVEARQTSETVEPTETAEVVEPAEATEQAAVAEQAEVAEPAEVVEQADVTEPAAAAEPAVATVDELTPVSVADADLPARAAAPPRAEAPPPPAAPEPVLQVASLPAIPTSGRETDSSDDGRTYGVVNQQARVVIGATADSWVQVLDGNQNVVLTRLLRAGDRYLVPNRSDLVMLTGNAGGLIISVDGERVPQIGSDGAILHNVRLDVELLKAGRAVIQ